MSKKRTYQELYNENQALRVLLQDTHEVVGSTLTKVIYILEETLATAAEQAVGRELESFNPYSPLDEMALLPLMMFSPKVGEA